MLTLSSYFCLFFLVLLTFDWFFLPIIAYFCKNFAYNCLLLLTLDWFWLHLLSNFCLLLIIICLYLLSFDYFCLLCLHSTILDYFGSHFTTFACVWFLKIFWNIFPQLSQVDVRLCKHFHRLHHVECRLDRLFCFMTSICAKKMMFHHHQVLAFVFNVDESSHYLLKELSLK